MVKLYASPDPENDPAVTAPLVTVTSALVKPTTASVKVMANGMGETLENIPSEEETTASGGTCAVHR